MNRGTAKRCFPIAVGQVCGKAGERISVCYHGEWFDIIGIGCKEGRPHDWDFAVSESRDLIAECLERR